MTVKETIGILADINTINLGYNGVLTPLDYNDFLAMAAYGNFVVDKVYACGDGVFELNLAM